MTSRVSVRSSFVGPTALIAVAFAMAAHAQPVIEGEADGQASNNSSATAQMLPFSAFQLNADPTVFGARPTARVLGRSGGADVDFYSFSAPAGPAYFDIDGAAPSLDTYIALFDASGTLLADNEDSFPADPGSASDRDAFLGSLDLVGGSYFIAVATSGNFANATFTGPDGVELFRPDGVFGGFSFPGATAFDSSFAINGPQSNSLAYTLSVTIIPAPAGVPLLALASIAALRRQRRKA